MFMSQIARKMLRWIEIDVEVAANTALTVGNHKRLVWRAGDESCELVGGASGYRYIERGGCRYEA